MLPPIVARLSSPSWVNTLGSFFFLMVCLFFIRKCYVFCLHLAMEGVVTLYSSSGACPSDECAGREFVLYMIR
jgi:hypothetical protein